LPSSATPITAAFSADKPDTYHKTTSFTTYGANGKAQLATIYYVKTANPTDTVPFSKWQTHVTIDGADVKSALTQSAGAGNDPQFINKFGEIKTQKELSVLSVTPPAGKSGADYLITAGTNYRKFSLDQLQTAVPRRMPPWLQTLVPALLLKMTSTLQAEVRELLLEAQALQMVAFLKCLKSRWMALTLKKSASQD
jgi:flagellar hook protein FlgE